MPSAAQDAANLLGSGNGTGVVEIPEKFYQPEQVEIDKEGKKESVPFDFDALQIPDKLTVKKEDGSIDFEKTSKRILASTHKAVAAHSSLEKMFGTDDAARLRQMFADAPKVKDLIADMPANEGDYKLDYSKMPEGFKISPEAEKGMLKKFYGMGIAKKAAQGIMDYFGSLLGEGQKIQAANAAEGLATAVNELKATFGADFPAAIASANRALNFLGDEEDKANVNAIGKDLKITYKTFMKFLAKVGRDIAEDNPPAGDGAGAGADIKALQSSEAYWNPKHKDHAATVQKVKDYYNKKYPEEKG